MIRILLLVLMGTLIVVGVALLIGYVVKSLWVGASSIFRKKRMTDSLKKKIIENPDILDDLKDRLKNDEIVE